MTAPKPLPAKGEQRKVSEGSFARRVKAELEHIADERECCRRSVLAGLIDSAGTLHILPGGRRALEVEAADAAVARAVYRALKALGTPPEIRLYTPGRGHPRERFVVRVETSDDAVFRSAGVLDRRGRPARTRSAKRCCAGAFLRGSFIVRGSVSEPRTPAHLEIRAPDAEVASSLGRRAAKLDVKAAARTHHGWAMYVKDTPSIGRLLAAMGAHRAYLEWEGAGVWSSVRAAANRLANCDEANAGRTARAALDQRAAIESLERSGRLGRLPPALQEVAQARMDHPDAALAELALLLDPPVSKAAVADRLRRLCRAAEQPVRADGRMSQRAGPARRRPAARR